jgi:AraC family transcriptional regulator
MNSGVTMNQPSETYQDYVARINKVLVYIQEHIDEEIPLKDLAHVACFSQYHFHRIFRAFTGETLHAHIRRLRIEKAAGKLKYTKQSITEIALDAGYETPSAFTKAFKKLFGLAPSNFRHQETPQNTMRLRFNTHKEENEMVPEYIEFKELPVLFVRRTGDYKKSACQAWPVLLNFIKDQGLKLQDVRCFGISHDDPSVTSAEYLRYDACFSAPQDVKAKGEVAKKVLKAGRYAVFVHKGPYEGLENTFDQIFGSWYPSSGEQLDESPCFCEYLNLQEKAAHPEALITRIYIPLK